MIGSNEGRKQQKKLGRRKGIRNKDDQSHSSNNCKSVFHSGKGLISIGSIQPCSLSFLFCFVFPELNESKGLVLQLGLHQECMCETKDIWLDTSKHVSQCWFVQTVNFSICVSLPKSLVEEQDKNNKWKEQPAFSKRLYLHTSSIHKL